MPLHSANVIITKHNMAQQLAEQRLNVNQYIRVPLSSTLNDNGINLIKRTCGFPDDWSYVDIGAWLSQFDYVPFSRMQMPVNNQDENIRHYISTNYDVEAGFWQGVDIVWLHIPIEAFDVEMMSEIAHLLVGPDFQLRDYDQWMRYILLGGPDRVRIGVRRYNPNINLNQMFENLNIHVYNNQM